MKKTILLLGGLGFIGKNLIEELKNDYNVIVFGRQPSQPNPDYTYYSGDFTKIETIEKILKKHKIDLIIHAISTTIPSNHDSIADIDSNVKSTIRLLDLMKQYHIPKIVFLSSGGTVYGLINERDGVSEDHPTYPISAHGVNKLTIEKYIYLYQRLHHIDYLILRLSNPYGEYHSSDQQGLINVTLKKIVRQEPITVWGNGDVIRDYIYIKDCVKIIHQLINKNISNRIINVGSNQGHSINELLAIIRQHSGDFEVIYTAARNFDVPKIVLDTSTLRSFIDVQLTPLPVGIENTYAWIKKAYGE